MSQADIRREFRKRPGPARRPSRAKPSGSTRLGDYLRHLREGYGYTLRRVEEEVFAAGETIDNSQLSRFEKGKAVPSFGKLRALANVFNVPVQNFSDVLDLEQFQGLKPETSDYQELLRLGREAAVRGDHGRAFVTYERALEVAQEGATAQHHERANEARWRMACTLKHLGKLFAAERELREILRDRTLGARTRLRSLLQMTYISRELGDRYLASVLAKECLALAREEGDLSAEVGVLTTLANVAQDEGDFERAVELYRTALPQVERLEGHVEFRSKLLTNLGGCLTSVGEYDEGMALLREAYAKAKHGGFRRVASLALTRMAEAHVARGDVARARRDLQDSDSMASRPEGTFHDILFLNAFLQWKMVREQGNRTGEKIAFGRLRHLRSLLQRSFPEVVEFDMHIERHRR